MMGFPNLAYRKRDGEEIPAYINKAIESELTLAGVHIVPMNGPQFEYTEVPFSMVGALTHKDKNFDEFCDMGKRHFTSSGLEKWNDFFEFVFVRRWRYWSVGGHVPLTIAQEIYANPVGKKSVRAGGHAAGPDPATQTGFCYVAGMDVVSCYHIDDQEGLNLFVETVKKHNLIRGGM